jgi:hypothetical protein
MPLLFGAVHPVVVGVYTAAILIACGGWLLLNSNRLPTHLFRSRALLFILFFIGWMVCTTLPLPMSFLEILSPVRAASLQAINQLAGTEIRWAPLTYSSSAGLMSAVFFFALLLYALSLNVLLGEDRSLLKKIMYVFIGMGVLEATYGMLQVINPNLGVLWLSGLTAGKGAARGTIIYKNQYASLLNMCWPLAVAAALLHFKKIQAAPPPRRRKTKRRRVIAEKINTDSLKGFLFLFLASFIMMAVLFSQSRGGTISMVVIMVLLLFFLPLQRKNKIRLSFCLLLITIFYGSAFGFSAIIDRFQNIEGAGLNRINIYRNSLPMLYDHLITGIGLNAYELLSPIYLKNFPENIHFYRTHNEYLELAIESGLPVALLFFSTLFTALFFQAKRLYRYRGKKISNLSHAKITAIVSFCAITGFLFHGIADFGWHLPVNLLYVVTLVVLVVNGIRSQTTDTRQTS